MSRTAMMTIGFLFIFIGIQLNFVESYVLTPRMTEFLSDKFSNNQAIANLPYQQPAQGYRPNIDPVLSNSPYQQASFPNQNNGFSVAPRPILGSQPFQSRVISPPRWICWPFIFLGAVFWLNGLWRR